MKPATYNEETKEWVYRKPKRDMYRPQEAARILGVSPPSLYTYARRSGLGYVYIKPNAGRDKKQLVFPHDKLVEFMENYESVITERFATFDGENWKIAMPYKEYYTVFEAARILGLSHSTIYQARLGGRLKCVRIHRRGQGSEEGQIHVPHSEVVGYIEWTEAKEVGFPTDSEGYEVLEDELI